MLITDYSDENEEPTRDQSGESPCKRTPLLCLDVNLGHGISPQVIIYEGDDPLEVAN